MNKTFEELMSLGKPDLINEAKNEIGFKFCEKWPKSKIADELVKFSKKEPLELLDQAGKLAGKKAEKDYHINQNHIDIHIKKGDDLKEVPNRFEQCLKSEGVI